jgi:hypothetical protein
MFSDEYSVQMREIGYSMFVEKKKIKGGSGGSGLMRAVLLSQDERFGTVVLPGETLEDGRNTIQIPLSMLEEG